MLVIVFVVDGLRPDSITREETPTLFRLRAAGVSFASSHAVFPTVTPVHAAALPPGPPPRTPRHRGRARDRHPAREQRAARQSALRPRDRPWPCARQRQPPQPARPRAGQRRRPAAGPPPARAPPAPPA